MHTHVNMSLFKKKKNFAGLDLNTDELLEDFPSLQTVSKHNYVPDAVLPPGEPWLRGGPSRALLSLPSCLQVEEMKVYAKCHLPQGVVFGPYVGEISRQVPSNLKYVWAVSRVTMTRVFMLQFLLIGRKNC